MFDHVIIIVWLLFLGRKAHARNWKCYCKTANPNSRVLTFMTGLSQLVSVKPTPLRFSSVSNSEV